MVRPDPTFELHATFSRRDSPEKIAELISQTLPDHFLQKIQRELLARERQSVRRRFRWSSMPEKFKEPAPPTRLINRARNLSLEFLQFYFAEPKNNAEMWRFLESFVSLIGKPLGARSFRSDRLNQGARKRMGLKLSRRRYSKLFRLAVRLEEKLTKLEEEQAKYRLLLIGNAALAPDLRRQQLRGHLPTASFIAYYVSRMRLRTEFTASSQQRPFDDLAAALFEICKGDPRTNWYAIAHVFPRTDVLARLTENQKGILLGRWFNVLSETAEWLESTYRKTAINLDTMVFQRGNDSSTWNLFASAWNRARDHWLALVAGLGLNEILDTMLPGKVLRLISADGAVNHGRSGRGIHEDTKVWAELPKPWEVLRLEKPCNLSTIKAVCEKNEVDPVMSGWVAAKDRQAISKFTPTPELVHGVAFENPAIAQLLRVNRAFSGKPAKKPIEPYGGNSRLG